MNSAVPAVRPGFPELAREIVAEIAPAELNFLPSVTQSWLAGELNGPPAGRRGPDWLGGSIGIGLDPDLITLVIYPVLTGALSPVMENAVMGGWRRWRRRRVKPRAEIPAFDAAQLELIGRRGYDCAVQAGLAKPTAQLLSNALVGALARSAKSTEGRR
jgi:hypothetical protein